MSQSKSQVVIIGGGPAGYVAAIRLAQLGKQATVIERAEVGGICLNQGCIPTKTILECVKIYKKASTSSEFLEGTDGLKIDWKGVMKRKEAVIKRLRQGVEQLLRSNGIRLIRGGVSFENKHLLKVLKNSSETERLETDTIVIATGSKPLPVAGLEFDGRSIISSSEALNLEEVPQSVTIIGGGVVGVEFATIFSSLGCETTIVELLPSILNTEDRTLSRDLAKILKGQGVKIYTEAKILSHTIDNSGNVTLAIDVKGEKLELKSEKVLCAAGRGANIEGLNLEKAGIETKQGFITTDRRMKTNIPGIFAVGDVTGRMMLAHAASGQGIVAAENIAGISSEEEPLTLIPRCIYTIPEMGCVGLTEETAKERGYQVKVGLYPFRASGKAWTANEIEGMTKIITDLNTKEILGVHILGHNATELIGEAVLAMKLESTAEELARTIHAHPTLSETLKEATLAIEGLSIHLPKP